MIEEIWKSIINYEGLYEISNYGRTKSLHYNKERILKPRKSDKCGHLSVMLCKKGVCEQYLVHRLVLETFVGSCPPGMECRHLDGNPKNNRLDNLKWGTSKENSQDSIKHGTINNGNQKGIFNPMAKLNDYKVRIINRLIEDGYLTYKEIAELFYVSLPIIYHIKNKESWKHIKEEENE